MSFLSFVSESLDSKFALTCFAFVSGGKQIHSGKIISSNKVDLLASESATASNSQLSNNLIKAHGKNDRLLLSTSISMDYVLDCHVYHSAANAPNHNSKKNNREIAGSQNRNCSANLYYFHYYAQRTISHSVQKLLGGLLCRVLPKTLFVGDSTSSLFL